MKKVIGIIGSPRKSGNSSSIVNEILRGAKDSGAETTVFYLNTMNIKGCQSCMYCRKNNNCCINDDMQEILENIKDSDAVIIGSPIYIYQVTGQTKIMMDRLYPLTDEKHKPRFGKRKLLMVYTQASPFFFSFRTYIRYLRNAFAAMGLLHYKDIIITKCFSSDVAKNNVKAMTKAYNVGKSLI